MTSVARLLSKSRSFARAIALAQDDKLRSLFEQEETGQDWVPKGGEMVCRPFRCAACSCMRTYYVYIMASRSRVLYTGVTKDLARRVYEHKASLIPGFTRRYRINRLVYLEEFGDIRDAIAREKQIKGWVRARKVRLIEEHNPTWEDRAEGWYLDPQPPH